MAAPTLATLPQKQKQKQPLKVNTKVKNVLHSPFESKWPVVDSETAKTILTKMQNTFAGLDLQPAKQTWNPASRGKNVAGKSSDEPKTSTKHSIWTEEQRKIRSELVFGINAVTRHLEQNKLDLVVVDRSSQPALLTRHLVALSAVRRCPSLALPDLADHVMSHLGITSLVTIGFKKSADSDTFRDLVKFIVERVPCIELPWLPAEQDDQMKTADISSNNNTRAKGDGESEDSDDESDGSSDISINDEISKPSKHYKSDPTSAHDKPELTKRPMRHVPLEEFPFKHLYLMKKDQEVEHFGSDFIKFSKGDDDDADTVYVKKNGKSKKRKLNSSHMDEGSKIAYIAANVGNLKSNLERKTTKKKKGRYFVPKK